MAGSGDLASAYNDDSVLFRVLRHLGWDSLVDIGYCTPPTLLIVILAGPVPFQRRPARRSPASGSPTQRQNAPSEGNAPPVRPAGRVPAGHAAV